MASCSLFFLLFNLQFIIFSVTSENRRWRSSTSSGSSADSKSDSFDDTDTDTDFSSLFTALEKEQIRNKRIRREIRDLDCDEWNRIVIAMNIMKTVSQSEGEELYGSRFRNYDSLVCQHSRFTRHTLGDFGHLGPHFLVVHRAFTLAFEESLLSIDNNIESLPYWNYYIDLNEYGANMTDSIIFSDEYFGDFTGNTDLNYAVSNGKFKFWKINTNATDIGCPSNHQNAFGLLRQPNNIEGNKYVTRIGGNVCNGPLALWENTVSAYDDCLNGNYSDITSFFWCMNFQVHAASHFDVAGTRPRYENQIVDDWPSCISWHVPSATVNNVRKFALDYGCFDCPEAGSCTVGEDDSIPCADCTLLNNGSCNIEGTMISINTDINSQHIIGDFYDLSTSPNDPIFFFHHANVDRYFMEWQLRQYNNGPYYDYPESGYETGINLNEVMSDEFPFVNLFNDNGGPYTYADVFDETTIVDAAYTFDSIVDLIDS